MWNDINEPHEPWQPLEHIWRYGFRDYPPPRVEEPDDNRFTRRARLGHARRQARLAADSDFSTL